MPASTSLVEGAAGQAAGEAAEADRENRRRRRRGGRGGRDRDEASGAEESGTAEGTSPATGMDAPAAEAGAETARATAPEAGSVEGDDEGRDGGRRRGRGRDRFRRERRPEGDVAAETADLSATPAQGAGPAFADGAAPSEAPPAQDRLEAPQPPVPAEAEAGAGTATLSAAATPEPSQAVAPAPAQVARAVVEPYVLPLAQLHQIAGGAGLQWVNSDAEKIASAQAAIAAHPRPVHVPRERKPVVVVDEGPLVLVETRKDLSQMKLPFEVGSSANAA
jgi:ribonuclease E